MLTIEIKEDTLVEALQRIARSKRSTVDKVAQEALRHYAQREQLAAPPYSFIGIGHSGKGGLSTAVDDILAEAANRREGWSLPERPPSLTQALCWPY
jgi:hypothetical protein